MRDTGRLRTPLTPSAARVIFKAATSESREQELQLIARVDRAHLIMLAEQGIVDKSHVARLILAINRLCQLHFAPLRHREADRGLYLLYEDYLIETEGTQIGGVLQTARSRNDLNATLFKLKLRQPYLRFLREALRFQATLLKTCRKYSTVVMPVYTHGQAAMPTTLGHYLLGVSKALQRDFDGILVAGEDLTISPLGAGAASGSSFPIDTIRTATLLGFSSGPIHSLDAVASRDVGLRMLAATVLYAITLSRLATDLGLWATVEFDFIRLPDEVSGSSSAMPQKKNPFLLEHVQGKTATLIGSFVQASASTHSTPFTNSIAAGTEAVAPVWSALDTVIDCVVLLRLIVAAAVPNDEAMLQRTIQGFTAATEYANRLVKECGIDFRTAHHIIGKAVRESLQQTNVRFEEIALAQATELGATVDFTRLDPAAIVGQLEYGGGPGPNSFQHCWNVQRVRWTNQVLQMKSKATLWNRSEVALERATETFLAETNGEFSLLERPELIDL